MVGGGIQLESGTLDDSSITTDRLILESRTQTHLEPFTIQLEEVVTETFKGDGTTKVFTLSTINTTTDANINFLLIMIYNKQLTHRKYYFYIEWCDTYIYNCTK